MTIYVHVSNNTEPTADVVSSSHPGKKIKGRGKTTWFSVQKKQKDIDNEKLKVIIPPDRTVAVGPGAKDFVTELSVKVLLHARHDVKKWKDVPNLAKDRIVAHMLDKLIEIVDEQIQEVEEGTDMDPIVNAAFVKLVGEKSGYCRGQGSGVKPASRRTMHVTQEQLQAQQREVEEERHK
ncbi:uncharacterized protein LOC107786477 isoform X1 [Nicotiana tabacum]|uniref:Uncharacterized protein LOC107786477 isoform X1 n=1 Tax=Nicotiana tabacum TaxID=4097 RepID=A0AC58S063_TOBAC|nr:uncharacterized protein LOC104115656 isoform X3 [Nicotiana tomentosiformis]